MSTITPLRSIDTCSTTAVSAPTTPLGTSTPIGPLLPVVGGTLQAPVINGRVVRHVNLDYAASAPALQAVADHVTEVLPYYASVHRGAGYASQVSTNLYESARTTIAAFVGARADDVTVITRNTTDSLNLLAAAVPTTGLGGGEVLVLDVEHHANLLPWTAGPHRVLPTANTVAQTLAVLEAVRNRPDAAKDRAVIVGQSYGGATAVATAAQNPPGVVGAINFAGGSGGNPATQPQQPCAPHLLERLYRGYGETARVPMLWLYTENDMYFGPTYPRAWHAAFVAAGGKAGFVQFPPHGDDGHSLFTRFPSVWQPRVAEFLDGLGFRAQPAKAD